MDERFLKPYDPAATEAALYQMWEAGGYFAPQGTGRPYTIIMPPPNANGRLHVGHALATTIQDILIRYHRLRGRRALWVPGADHAGFETQIVYEKKLEKEGRSRFKMPAAELYREIMAFTLENKKQMEADLRALGASCDWTRAKFTLDADVIAKTQATFKKMFAEGLVYRGERLINWCPKHQTSLSDLETEAVEREDTLYYLQYGPFVIATARPETKFGDKFVVVHPADERYREFAHGQKLELEWINGPLTATVIKDEAIAMEFGTGAMTITPWHDPADFAIAERHGLPREQIIDWRGRLLPLAGEFAGQKISEARATIVAKLKEKGLLVREEPYRHAVKVCYKCATPIEPQIKDQWFVKMRPLAERALTATRAGKLKFIPENYEKIFNYWMENTQDWNISRQIVWGIPIPAKICDACHEGWPDLEDELSHCSQCGGALRADTDTFDTWFSSGQWPLLALGWPGSDDFKTYFPTAVMETGHDLIFKWVPRMVFFSLYLTGQVPFHTVYLHGLVNDERGKKMSKSKGNVVSPLDLTGKYGTDALRMGLVVGNTPGTDLALTENKIKGYKHFANKIWNAARFVLSHKNKLPAAKPNLAPPDEQALASLDNLVKEVTADLENYRLHLAAEKLYHYFWHEFADKIIEAAKPRLEDPSAIWTLFKMLETQLVLLHPFMPFITESIWPSLRAENKNRPLIAARWPIN